MISTQVLMQEQARIEEKARANVEANYQKRVTELDRALAAAKISSDQYEAQLTALEEQYERFEPLLQTMSRYYALTDYDSRDSLSARISERIEAGDLDEAERLIKAKGNIADREAQLRKLEEQNKRTEQLLAEAQKRLQEQQAEAKRQLKDLAEDCYHLFTIHLERFENDSAEYYICRRAQLDTTNVEYQLVAGQFLMDYRAKYELADAYFRNALRLAESQYGEISGDVATALSSIGLSFMKQQKYDEALDYLQRSAKMSEQLRGKESQAMAESYDNLGALYLKMGDTKSALSCLREAVKIYEKTCPSTDPYIPRARNNLGNALFKAKKYDEAKDCFDKALAEFQKRYGEKHYDVANVYNNLASIAFIQGRLDESEQLFEKALALFTQILGEHHPKTLQTKKNLEHLRKYKPKK
jgi:tetratricopeptide (TPR) repeat protein